MNCEIVKNFIITDYIDREIDDIKFKYVKEHLDHCILCRDFEKRLVRVNGVIKNFEYIKPPESLWTGIKDNIVSLKEKSKKETSFLRSLKAGIQDFFIPLRPKLAAAGVSIFIGVIIFIRLSVLNTPNINEYIGEQLAFLTSLDKDSMDYGDMFFIEDEINDAEYFF